MCKVQAHSLCQCPFPSTNVPSFPPVSPPASVASPFFFPLLGAVVCSTDREDHASYFTSFLHSVLLSPGYCHSGTCSDPTALPPFVASFQLRTSSPDLHSKDNLLALSSPVLQASTCNTLYPLGCSWVLGLSPDAGYCDELSFWCCCGVGVHQCCSGLTLVFMPGGPRVPPVMELRLLALRLGTSSLAPRASLQP